MSKERACKICKKIYEDKDKCPVCGAKEYSESYKGKIYVHNPEKSEIAQKLDIHGKGDYAIRTK